MEVDAQDKLKEVKNLAEEFIIRFMNGEDKSFKVIINFQPKILKLKETISIPKNKYFSFVNMSENETAELSCRIIKNKSNR